MEHRHLGPLRRPRHRRLRPVAVRHQAIVKEVAQVPVLAEGTGPEILQVVDVQVPREVVVRDLGRELEEVLLFRDLVRLLLVRGLRVLLQVRVVMRLEPAPDIDQVRVVDRRAHAGQHVPVVDQSMLEEHDVHDLPDQRAREGPEPEPSYPFLDLAGDLACGRFVRALAVVEGSDQAGLDQDLPDDPFPVPVQDMPVRAPDGRHRGEPDPVEGCLAARLRRSHGLTHPRGARRPRPGSPRRRRRARRTSGRWSPSSARAPLRRRRR
ncbi:hypothetical protein DSECCO2_461390 [anaerobic digester metagenome]